MICDIADMASPCRDILLSLDMELHSETYEYPADEYAEDEMSAFLRSSLEAEKGKDISYDQGEKPEYYENRKKEDHSDD